MNLDQVVIKPNPINWEGLSKRFMNPGELEILCALMQKVNPKTVIEFGIHTGRTAKAILREVEGIEKYVGVDVLPGYQTSCNVQRREVPIVAGEFVIDDPRVELIVTHQGSHGLEPSDLPLCDAVFIDGDHSRSGVEKDTYLAKSRIRKGGIIIWHDYNHLRDKRGKSLVDVAEVLHEYAQAGCDIKHVENTWLAYEIL